jgi:Ca2+-binding EF-hand superfamily protein
MIAVAVVALAMGQPAPSAFEPTLFPDAPRAIPAPEPATQHAFLLQFDRDRNGVLTLEELPEPLRKRFDRADLNRDGKLDARELLVGPTRISREARRAEDIVVTRQGLAKRGPNGPQAIVFSVGTEILRRLDRNGDGWVDRSELGSLLQQPGVVFGDPNQTQPAAATAVASHPAPAASPLLGQEVAVHPAPALPSPAANPNPFVPTPYDAAEPLASRSPPQPPGPAAAPPAAAPAPVAAAPPPASPAPSAAHAPLAPAGPGNLPDARTILEHLDRNGNGFLDRDEAVDQLADNFDRLDKNRDGILSEQEIKRGLFLARMFGVKPKQDPETYRTK